MLILDILMYEILCKVHNKNWFWLMDCTGCKNINMMLYTGPKQMLIEENTPPQTTECFETVF